MFQRASSSKCHESRRDHSYEETSTVSPKMVVCIGTRLCLGRDGSIDDSKNTVSFCDSTT